MKFWPNEFSGLKQNSISAKRFGEGWANARYEMLSERVQATGMGRTVKSLVEQVAIIKKGNAFPAIVLPDIAGQPVSIQDFKGKVLLVDFWASWCFPCRREIPALKKIYKNYKSQGFEVVAVSLDDDFTKWKKAIESENLPWINVSDLKEFHGEMAKHLRIQSIPLIFYLTGTEKFLLLN